MMHVAMMDKQDRALRPVRHQAPLHMQLHLQKPQGGRRAKQRKEEGQTKSKEPDAHGHQQAQDPKGLMIG